MTKRQIEAKRKRWIKLARFEGDCVLGLCPRHPVNKELIECYDALKLAGIASMPDEDFCRVVESMATTEASLDVPQPRHGWCGSDPVHTDEEADAVELGRDL
jgi:hypothetical protein